MEKRLFIINSDSAFFVDPLKDFNTEFGILHSSDLKKAKAGSQVKTHKGIKFFVIEPTIPDLVKKIIRLPQIITLKDLGSIIAYSGIKSNSKILEAGTGSGFSACVMASMARNGKVVSYEIRKDFAKVAKKNVTLFGLDNIKIINADIKDGIKERGFDFVLLDMPDPWKAVGLAAKGMKIGARICTYSPSIIQIEKTIRALPDTLKVERLMTVTENDWKVELDRDILRPQSDGLTHTAFLLFSRKVTT